MTQQKGSNRIPRSEAHRRLGDELRQLRQSRGLTLRQLGGDMFTDGHLSNVENGHTMPSPELLEHYVRHCGGNYAYLYLLRQTALNVKERRRRELHATQRGLALPNINDLYDPPDPSRLYTLDHIDTHMHFDGNGIPQELRVVIKLRARLRGLDRYYFGIGCHGDYRPGAVRPETGFGCSIGNFRESRQGVIDGYFLLDQKLSPDDPEPHTFSFRIIYATARRGEHPIISQPKTDTARKVMRVQFTPPSLPTNVWWYDTATAVEIEADQPEAQVLPDDPSGYYYCEWAKLTIGRCYGIDWQWELQ